MGQFESGKLQACTLQLVGARLFSGNFKQIFKRHAQSSVVVCVFDLFVGMVLGVDIDRTVYAIL